MRVLRWLSPTLLIISSLPLLIATPFVGVAAAQEGPHWRLNLDEAEKLAMQSNRLVLIHFWAPWCGPCRALEKNVFAQPGVGPALEGRFVPVRINLDEDAYSATARLYEIRQIPTDVIITPSGRLIAKIPCPQDPRVYVAQLMHAAGDAAPPANVYAQAPMVPATPPPSYQPAPPSYQPAPVGYQPPPSYQPAPTSYQPPPAEPRPDAGGMSMYSSGALPGPADASPPPYTPAPGSVAVAPPSAAPSNPVPPPDPTPVAQATAQQPIAPQAPSQFAPPPATSARPPLGLDGYCPVTLIERHHETPADPRCWVQGNPRWGVVHRGTVYLFVGPDEQKRFLADPDRYSPALSGNDPVLAFDQGRLQQGTRQFGTFFGDRIFLFTSAENLAKFAQSRDIAGHYADEVRQAESNSHGAMH